VSEIDSQALLLVDEVLGVAGGKAASTELDDGRLDQVLNVNDIIRRSRSVQDGIFWGLWRNIHAAAGEVSSNINPYTTPSDTNTTGWETPIPRKLEVWVLGATVSRSSGAGGLDEALLELRMTAVQQAFGEDSAGAAIAGQNANMALARWDVISELTTRDVALTETGAPFARIGLRVPRRSTIRFTSDAAAAANFDLQVLLGLFPRALGQDIAV